MSSPSRADARSPAIAGRGEATRERLVAAALELFGQKGFEGVGARELARQAGVPLGAIPYHFGTMEALYRAALERIRERLGQSLEPAVEEAARALAGPPSGAGEALARLQSALLDAIAVAPEAEAWAKLLLREHLDPSPSFDLVYEDAARRVVELIARLIAHGSGRGPDDPDVLIEAFARMGEVVIFRTAQAAVTRRLGWASLDATEADLIRRVLFPTNANPAASPPRSACAPPRPG